MPDVPVRVNRMTLGIRCIHDWPFTEALDRPYVELAATLTWFSVTSVRWDGTHAG